jgi:hypothetical protein
MGQFRPRCPQVRGTRRRSGPPPLRRPVRKLHMNNRCSNSRGADGDIHRSEAPIRTPVDNLELLRSGGYDPDAHQTGSRARKPAPDRTGVIQVGRAADEHCASFHRWESHLRWSAAGRLRESGSAGHSVPHLSFSLFLWCFRSAVRLLPWLPRTCRWHSAHLFAGGQAGKSWPRTARTTVRKAIHDAKAVSSVMTAVAEPAAMGGLLIATHSSALAAAAA